MLTHEEISLIKRRRQELRIWLIENETTFKALAEAIGIKSPTLDAHLNKCTMPVDHHRKLVQTFHIPLELLPEPKDVRPGRKPLLTFSQMSA